MEPKPPQKPKAKIETPEILTKFRKEIAALGALRKAGKGLEEGMIELADVDADELTLEDALIWNKIKDYTPYAITMEEYEVYSASVQQDRNKSREEFRAVIANKLSPLWFQERLDFYKEAAELFKELAEKTKKSPLNSHESSENINSRELTYVDQLMWHRVKNYKKGSVTNADLEKYRADVAQYRNPTRTLFEEIVATRLTDLKIQEEEKEKNNGNGKNNTK